MRTSVAALQASLQYQFKDPALLERALTHRSMGNNNNERLEFLGDAILGLVVAEALYSRFPRVSEGQLSRMRASIVNGKTLASIAKNMALGDYLILGSGELKSGGFRRESILAGAFEALLGAIYLDGGLPVCKAIIERALAEVISRTSPDEDNKDPKTALQELMQARKLALPLYALVNVTGQAHDQRFTVTCTIAALTTPTTGEGSSRRAAEQDAASKALAQLKQAPV